MIRRPPVKRSKGIPVDHDRCIYTIAIPRGGEMFAGPCLRPRLRGHAYCSQHRGLVDALEPDR